MALDTGSTISVPTRFPGGVTTASPVNPLALLEVPSPFHSVLLGWHHQASPTLPLGTPATNADWTVTSVRVGVGATQALSVASVWPPAYLLSTDNAANDQEVLQERRTIKKNFLSLRKVIVGGVFQVTSTVANQNSAFGLFSGTSLAALGNDQFAFSLAGATLSFVTRNNAGTALSTSIATGVTINTMYGAVAVLNPTKSTVSVWFGTVDSLGFKTSTLSPQEIAVANSGIAVGSTNVPDGTNAIQLGFGSQTTAAAAATVQFSTVFAYLA